MTRNEHLAWCKQRALAELDRSGCREAVASMTSDLDKHDSTRIIPALFVAVLAEGLHHVQNQDTEATRRWINGFN